PPTAMSGLILNPDDQKQFDALTASLWGGLDGKNETQKQVGAGHVFWGLTVLHVLRKQNTLPDFEQIGCSYSGQIDWIHRAGDGADIYYVASRWEDPEKIAGTFRVSGRQPELWDR